MGERPLIRHWGRCWKLFSGQWKSPWQTQLWELNSGREGEGSGNVVVLERDALGPVHVVEATFALMGVWWRGSGQGWVQASTGLPAMPSLDKQRAAFDAVKASIASTDEKERYKFEYPVTLRPGFHVEQVLAVLSDGPPRQTEEGLVLRRFRDTGSFHLNGRVLDAAEVVIPFRTPFFAELVVYDYWNRRMVVGGFGSSWILVDWCTSA